MSDENGQDSYKHYEGQPDPNMSQENLDKRIEDIKRVVVQGATEAQQRIKRVVDKAHAKGITGENLFDLFLGQLATLRDALQKHVAGLTTGYFPARLAGTFALALRGDRDQTLRIVRAGGGEIGRLYRLCVQLSQGQALQLGRQIQSATNGTEMSPVQLDTSETATATIAYVATEEAPQSEEARP